MFLRITTGTLQMAWDCQIISDISKKYLPSSMENPYSDRKSVSYIGRDSLQAMDDTVL